MARNHVIETDPGILAMREHKRKKRKRLIIVIVALLLAVVCVAAVVIFRGNKIKTDPLNAEALKQTEAYVEDQILEYENAGGYQGKFELNTFHGYKISTIYEDESCRAVLIRYKLKQNKYNSYISDDLYYTLSVFKDGELILFDTGTGEKLPTTDSVVEIIR